jgi:hypothetical protein
MSEGRVQIFNRRLDDLREDFESWKDHLEDISDYILPWHGRFLGRDTKFNDGDKRDSKIIDDTATWSCGVLAAGMQSGLTSPARDWFRLTLEDKDLAAYAPVKEWLDEVKRRMNAVFNGSNYYTATHMIYAELGGFGTGPMFIEEDKKSIIRCTSFTAGEYYLSNDPSHRVDTLYRHFWMKARNVVAKFGEENCSRHVKDLNRKHGDKPVRIIHVVEPNEDRMIDKIDSKNMPIRSVYYEHGTKDKDQLLSEKGFEEFPIMAPRWVTVSSDVYGWSPGMMALANTRMLQKMQRKGMEALDKLVDPPMNAPTSMKNATKTIIPGGVNYVDSGQGRQSFAPTFQIQPDFQSMEYKNAAVQEHIKRAFFVDVFRMIDSMGGTGQKTATEIIQLQAEKMMLLGPVIERLQPELLDRVIDRTYSIMFRNQLIPPPPEELDQIPLKVEYVSVLAQAQKQVGTSNIEQMLAYIQNAAQTEPSIIDKFNFDESADQYADMIGVSPSIMNDDDDVDNIRAERQRQIALQQQAQMAQQAVDGAKTLSETDTQGENALTNLMSQIPS